LDDYCGIVSIVLEVDFKFSSLWLEFVELLCGLDITATAIELIPLTKATIIVGSIHFT